MKLRALLIFICFVGSSYSARRPGATFLLIPPTARATGMAYAWTAIANDASANYYNGAGLGFQYLPNFSITYFKYLPGFKSDMKYLYLAGSYPLINSAWGFDFIYFTLGKTPVIDSQGRFLGEYIIWRSAVKLNYARRIGNNLSLGFGVKYVYQKYGLFRWDWSPNYPIYTGWDTGGTGSAFGFDFNSLARILSNLSLGAVIHNLGSISYTDDGSSAPLPCLLRLGICYIPMQLDNLSIIISAELTKILTGMFVDQTKSFTENLKYEFVESAWKGIGGEINLARVLALRLGYFYDSEGARKGITYGGGIKLERLEFDIGIDEKIYEFPTPNRKVSLTYCF
ncbi:MAG: PorV/PorQ family protein [candidate division WOR-3 bacterium]